MDAILSPGQSQDVHPHGSWTCLHQRHTQRILPHVIVIMAILSSNLTHSIFCVVFVTLLLEIGIERT